MRFLIGLYMMIALGLLGIGVLTLLYIAGIMAKIFGITA